MRALGRCLLCRQSQFLLEVSATSSSSPARCQPGARPAAGGKVSWSASPRHEAQRVRPLSSVPPPAQPPATRNAQTKRASQRGPEVTGEEVTDSTAPMLHVQTGTGSLTRSIKVRVEVCHEEEVEDKQQEARKRYQIWGQPGREDLRESSKRTHKLIKTRHKDHVVLPATAQTGLQPPGC